MNLIAFAVWLLLCFSAQNQVFLLKVAGQEQSPTTSEFQTYDGSKYGMSIQYPSSWKTIEDTSGVWIVSPADEAGNVRVQSQTSQNVSLAELVQYQLLQSKDSYKDFNIMSSNMTTIDQNPANRTDYKFKVEIPKFLGADIFDYDAIKISTVKDDRAYTITYFAPPETFYIFLPIVQKMLQTLKIM